MIDQQKNDNIINLKIIIVGDAGTGKTSIITRYAKEKFEPNSVATISPLYHPKVLKVNGNNYQFNIWDIPGQDKNAIMNRSFAQDAKGIIYCCVVNNVNSRESLKSWEESINSYTDTKTIPKIIVENKCDLLGDEIHYNDDINLLEKTSEVLGCFKCFRVSALNGYNVNEAFQTLINEIIKNAKIKGLEKIDTIKLKKKQGKNHSKCC